MGKRIKEEARAQELEPVSLSELIHQHVRAAIETAVHEELRAALGTSPYERRDVRRGYRNGVRERTLTGPTGPVALTLPRATLFSGAGDVKEWTSRIVPRYQRWIPEVNEAVIASYLAGGNTRRIRGTLQPLLKAAPLSKSAVSHVIATLKGGLDAWRTRSLTDLDAIYVYLDGFALRVRSGGKVVSVPVLGVVGVLVDGGKQLLALELCAGESFAAWKGCLDDLVARGLQAPVLLAIIDGNAGLRRAVGLGWPKAAVQRCCVHKLRNLERKAPKHALAEIRDDFRRIVYAANADTARTAYAAFERIWNKRCPGVVTSLREGGDELLTFFRFPKTQWKTLRTTNTIERLHEEFRRRVKTQGSLPTEDAALVPALQPRGERADQVAQDRRLAEDRHRAQAADSASRMMRPPPRSCRPVSDLSRVVKISVLRCTASQDIKAKPSRSLSYKGAFHQLSRRSGTVQPRRVTLRHSQCSPCCVVQDS